MAREPIAPPFRTSLDAALYCLVVGFVLLLPLALRARHAPSHRTRIATAPTSLGEYSFLQHEVYDETSDLDAVVLGDSIIWQGMDTKEIQRALSQALGREARVISLGWFWTGNDILYYTLRDLLARRKVAHVILRLLPEDQTRPAAHGEAYRWLLACEHDPVIPTLGLTDSLQAYGIQTVGAPRNLLSLLRPDLVATSFTAPWLGYFPVALQMDGPFHAIDIPAPRFPLDMLLVDTSNRAQRLHAVTVPVRGYQHAYALAVRDLLRSHAVPVTLVRVPTRSEARDHTLVVAGDQLSQYENEAGFHLLVPDPGRLFAQVSDSDLDSLYRYDGAHLNRNGARYFTLAIMPALVEIQRGLHGH